MDFDVVLEADSEDAGRVDIDSPARKERRSRSSQLAQGLILR